MNDEILPEPPAPPSDEELPPPPSDEIAESKGFPELKIKKPKPLATARRAFIIFEKDIRTMAKHGLVSAVILFIFLAVVFSIMSFSMKQAMQLSFGDNGKESGIPGASGVDLPTARVSVTPSNSVTSQTEVTFDARGSTDNSRIVYYEWDVKGGENDFRLYGDLVHYTFYATGSFDVNLTVVDDEWNMDESSIHIEVSRSASSTDTESPMVSSPPEPFNINAGEVLDLNGSAATDNVGVVNWTWYIHDVEESVLYGEMQSYRFMYMGNWGINLVARDAAGNTGKTWASVNVQSMQGSGGSLNVNVDIPTSVTIGERVELSCSDSGGSQGLSYVWYVRHNDSLMTFTGRSISFDAEEFGPYEVKLIVRDNSGNYNTNEGMMIATPEGMEFSLLGWTSTPFGQEISFNLLTYAYGIALLASVIYVGGFFAKGFTHEITKGTVKVLFFGPISVTTMVFSKILYPLIVGPIFIFPLVYIGLYQFEQPLTEVLTITLVSYIMAAATMVAAAYGSNIIYLGTKKMVVKPSIISRMFLYFSLIGSLTVFEWMSFVLDNWQGTTSWDAMYQDYSGIATLSPFHQGGMFLSDMLIGTHWGMDVWVFIIPAVLIVGGVLASTKLYGDIFSRE